MTTKAQITFLKIWHAWLLGSYAVAYITGDDMAYLLHWFAGYSVLAALLVRLLIGLPVSLLARGPAPLALSFMRRTPPGGGKPLLARLMPAMALALLVTVGLAAFSGYLADDFHAFEDPHEVLATVSLWVIGAHFFHVILRHPPRFLGVLQNGRPA